MRKDLLHSLRIVTITFTILVITGFGIKPENNLSTSTALEKYGTILKNRTFLLIPELRENPIKWFDSIPEKRLKEGFLPKLFNLTAQPGEYYVYQIGFWALRSDVSDISVVFSDLKNKDRKIIPVGRMTCFNKGGINFRGEKFIKEVSVPAGRVQTLWMGIDLNSIEKGTYEGSVLISCGNEKQVVPLQLNVTGEVVADYGYNEGKRLSRLNWLNSTVGSDDSITKGYLPVKLEGNKVSVLGRTLQIAENGLPSSIISYFTHSNQSLSEKGEPLINSPFRFVIEKGDGKTIMLQPGSLKILSKSPSTIVWNVQNTSDEFNLDCTGQMEFEGFVGYKLKLSAKASVSIKDIRIEIPMNKDNAEYMMGLNHEGGYRSSDWKWKWDTSWKNQDKLWIGSVTGGLQIKWKAENYKRPLVNTYYRYSNLNLPPSWGNEGKGGVDIFQENNEVVVKAYSGSRQMKRGDILNYDFELLITPFRTIDKKIKFDDRYFHGGGSIVKASGEGANIMNIHHGSELYPFINYPYLDENVADLTSLVSDAHKANILMKFYYTTRELTVKIPEIWAFQSLQGEVIFPGPGNESKRVYQSNLKDDWLQKNLREKYIPAWSTTIKSGKFEGWTDLSVITQPDSRLNNFYVAGLDWMVRNIKVDGMYVDDCALERYTLRRARKVLDRNRPQGKIDFHAPNLFIQGAGFTNSLNLYMELLPYIDLTWIGEGRDYNRAPDHWLIEVSGIPFGLTSQMLQGGGNPWRGMVYGITNRSGYGGASPADIWKFWDKHQIENKEMIGYWEKECPVKCYNPFIKATVYKGEDESLIAIANFYKFELWGIDNQPASVEVDFRKLGIDQANCDITIPEIPNYQKQESSVDLNKIIIPGGKGYIIVIKKKN
jgi:hypothetical protein